MPQQDPTKRPARRRLHPRRRWLGGRLAAAGGELSGPRAMRRWPSICPAMAAGSRSNILILNSFPHDVEAQIENAGLDRPVLVGHSLGGMIAQTMLRRKPQGYQAVVLVGTSPAFGKADGDFQKQFVEERLAPLALGPDDARARGRNDQRNHGLRRRSGGQEDRHCLDGGGAAANLPGLRRGDRNLRRTRQPRPHTGPRTPDRRRVRPPGTRVHDAAHGARKFRALHS